jgi:hypothetical protein
VQVGRTFTTYGDHNFCQLSLDHQQEVYSIVYIGRASLTPERLLPLIGLPSSYLSPLITKYETGTLLDLSTVFTEPWVDFLGHDRFQAFRQQLLEALQCEVQCTALPSSQNIGKALQRLLSEYQKEMMVGGQTIMSQA